MADKVVYPVPKNLNLIKKYIDIRVDKMFEFINYLDKLKVKYDKKEFKDKIIDILLSIYNINNFEIGIYNEQNLYKESRIRCTRCKKEYIVTLNNTFCPSCNLIRLLYDYSELNNFLLSNKPRNKSGYLIVDSNHHYEDLIIYEESYKKILMSTIGKLKYHIGKSIDIKFEK